MILSRSRYVLVTVGVILPCMAVGFCPQANSLIQKLPSTGTIGSSKPNLYIITRRQIASKLFQNPSLPSFDELSQQKSEALRSMSEFHDGTWICESGAISSDVSGGSIMRSPPFKTSISTRLGLAADNSGEALKLVETMSWEHKHNAPSTSGKLSDSINNEEEQEEESAADGDTFFGRSCSLGIFADVDGVDGSYSLHETMKDGGTSSSCALPESISGVDPQKITSVIESCLVATQTERVRCFMIYGKSGMGMESEMNSNESSEVDVGMEDGDEQWNDQRLLRTVIAHERKKLQSDDLDDFIQVAISPLNANSRADQLTSAMSGSSSEDHGKNVKYPMNMMTLSLGPWLGDIIIRDRSFNALLPTTKKGDTPIGFGSPKKKTSSKSKNRKPNFNREGGFGEWVLGVQKVAMTFKYDFDCNVRQTFDYGKSMGVYEEGWPRQSCGIIYDDRMSRRIKPEDRSMYIDYDNGAYCGYIFGSVYTKAPRFLTRQRQGSALPMLTEFALFQKPEDTNNGDKEKGFDFEANIAVGAAIDDICCSRITRLYNDDGTLKQGSTSFFVLKPMLEEIDDNQQGGEGGGAVAP